MYSLNVPVPGSVAARTTEVARDLPGARARRRDEHTLVAKRLGRGDRTDFQRLASRAREALAGQSPFELRAAGIDTFTDPASGEGPVVYVAVESPELEALHERLCSVFDPIDGVEGRDYVPHVTVARGGDPDLVRGVVAREFDPLTWTATDLLFWDGQRQQPTGTVSLPA